MASTAANLWWQRCTRRAVSWAKGLPARPRAKKLARYGAAGLAALGLLGGGLSYSPSFRQHFAARVLPVSAFRTNYIQHHRKQSLFASLHGRVLELGPGAGANFAYFPGGVVQWTGVEHNPEVLPSLYDNAAAAGLPPAALDVQVSSVQQYLRSTPSNSVDAVVSTYVLGSVADSEYRDVIGEVHRVLKPGGRFYFVEPVARDAGTVARALQNLMSPLYRLYGGYSLNHETDKAIAAAGFDRVATEWWAWKSDWAAANAQARAIAAAQRANQSVSAAANTISTSGSVVVEATGTRPVMAGIAVKAQAAAPQQSAVDPAFSFNYGLFRR